MDKSNNPRRKTGNWIKENVFTGWRVYDYFIAVLCTALVIGLGVYAKSAWYVILAAAFNMAGAVFNIRTSKIYFLFSLGYIACYAYSSFVEHVYGEVIITLAFSLPLTVSSVIKWFTAKDVKESATEINTIHPIKVAIICVIGAAGYVAYFFIQKAIPGAEMVALSAAASIFSLIAYFLTVKRLRLQWVFWLCNCITYITMWSIKIALAYKAGADNPLGSLPLVAQSGVYLILNAWGLYSWCQEYRRRNKAIEPDDEESVTDAPIAQEA